MNNYTSALQSHHIRRKRFGEIHSETAVSLYFLGITQMGMGDITSDLQSHRHALDIRLKLIEEKHASTAIISSESPYIRWMISPQLQSHQCALRIRLELLGEEHVRTANSYY